MPPYKSRFEISEIPNVTPKARRGQSEGEEEGKGEGEGEGWHGWEGKVGEWGGVMKSS